MSKSYKHKLHKVNKFEDDEVDCIVWASGQPLRSLANHLFKQKKDDPLERVASPPPQLWGELDSPINNQGGYSCDVVSLASCTIFFSHYAYSITILHFSVLQASLNLLSWQSWIGKMKSPGWMNTLDIFQLNISQFKLLWVSQVVQEHLLLWTWNYLLFALWHIRHQQNLSIHLCSQPQYSPHPMTSIYFPISLSQLFFSMVVLGLPLFLLPSGAQERAMLHSMFLRIWPMTFHCLYFYLGSMV